jgi:hypothetical protein
MFVRFALLIALTLTGFTASAIGDDPKGYAAFEITDAIPAGPIADAPETRATPMQKAAVSQPLPESSASTSLLPWIAAATALALGLGGFVLVRASDHRTA